MAYQTLYRKWRPQTFAGLAGQDHVVRTLQNAISLGRLSHAYLFCGPRGTGKTSAARILAKAINCAKGPAPEPCNECPACLGIQAGKMLDVMELDAASNRGIDEIRDLRDKARYAPLEVRHKVYIIDEVHMLTQEAFNALLKTLEEPPSRLLFILATTEPHKLPATIISRCQRLDFRLIHVNEIAEMLGTILRDNNHACSEAARYLIAEEAAGGLRDALSLLEQVMAYSRNKEIEEEDVLAVLGAVGRDVYYQLAQFIIDMNLTAALLLLRDVSALGKDMFHFTQQAIVYFRDLMVAGVCGEEAGNLGIAPQWALRLKAQADSLGLAQIGRILSELHFLLTEIRWADRPLLLWELAVIRILNITSAQEESTVAVTQEWADFIPQTKETPAKVYAPVKNEQTAADDSNPDWSRIWPKVMELMKKESVRTHALLLQSEITAGGAADLEIRFENQFLCERMESAYNKKALESVLSRFSSRLPNIRCVTSAQASAPAESAGDPQEIILSAAEIFNGRVIDDKD